MRRQMAGTRVRVLEIATEKSCAVRSSQCHATMTLNSPVCASRPREGGAKAACAQLNRLQALPFSTRPPRTSTLLPDSLQTPISHPIPQPSFLAFPPLFRALRTLSPMGGLAAQAPLNTPERRLLVGG